MPKEKTRQTDFDSWSDRRETPDIQHRILLDLTRHRVMTFNQLWNKQEYSNQFAYHLKVLLNQGWIEKVKAGYRLTAEGKAYVAYLKRETGAPWQFPIVAVITVILDEKKKRVLLLERAQEPFLGYAGFHGGKLAADQYILDCAQNSIKQETGLSCTLELKGLFSSKTYEKSELLYSHQLFIVKATSPKGTLIPKTEKGTNAWVTHAELKKRKILPNIPLLLKIAQGKRFRWIEADRAQNADKMALSIKRDTTL